MVEHGAMRVGFTEQFGQEADTNAISTLRTAYLNQHGESKTLVELMRALNGLPVEPPILTAGSNTAKITRAINELVQLIKD
jgi:hypothetical protein